MNAHTRKLFFKVVLWMISETFLSQVQLDDLADMSEYIFERHCNCMLTHPSHLHHEGKHILIHAL